MERQVLNIVTVGHVDHGKSTVIGRMLADAGALPEGKLEAIQESCRRNSKPFEYAFLLDALKNEQAQGITIDTARCFFKTDKRDYIVIDAPGHVEFLKNMVTGASRAEAALMIIDASHGVEENSRRHGYFLSMLGIKQVAVLINKMDLVGYDRDVFRKVKREFGEFLRKINITPAAYIPVSGVMGDNVVTRSEIMPWYKGNTVLEQMDMFMPSSPPSQLPFRMPVQGVYKFTRGGDSRRIIAGTVESGSIKVGDEVVFYPSGKRTKVASLEVFSAPTPERYEAGQAAGFTMTEEIFVRRGETACVASEAQSSVGLRFRANLFWLGRQPLKCDKRYFLKCGTAKVEMRVEKIERVVNASDLNCQYRQYVDKNEVAECIITLERPIAYDLAGQNDSTSRFVIVDAFEISGGGIITESLPHHDYDVRNIRMSTDAMTADERARISGRRGMVVWMSGLSGSGKSTIAQEAERRLMERGIAAYVLDGDKLRSGICSDLGFSENDRIENNRRAAQIADLFRDSGLVTIVTLISPYEKGREQARKICRNFMEVYVKADVASCIKRDPKKLYAKALAGRIRNFTGVDAPYEEPKNPDVVLDTVNNSADDCVEQLIDAIVTKLKGSVR